MSQYAHDSVCLILDSKPKWEDAEYRQAYMEAAVEQGIAWQVRINRTIRGLSQRELAAAVGTGQSAIARLEDPSHGSHNIDTLLKVAHAFDCALSVKLVSYSQLAYESEKLSEAEQFAAPFHQEMKELNELKQTKRPTQKAFRNAAAKLLRRSAFSNAD